MKRILCFFLVFLFAFSACMMPATAHKGKTDANGGHYDRSTGEYHYHHGYPAHQHTSGVCPYDFDDQTDHSSHSGALKHLPGGSTSSLKPVEKPEPPSDQAPIWWVEVLCEFAVSILCIFCMWLGLFVLDKIFLLLKQVVIFFKSASRTRKILATSIVAAVSALFFWILSDSDINGTIAFCYIYDSYTGEYLSLVESIFLYIFEWLAFGIVPSSVLYVLSIYICFFLHRRDEATPGVRQSVEDDTAFCGLVSFCACYILLFVLIALHGSGLISTHLF